jgi:hypothetical protein
MAGSIITLADASKMTATFRKNYPSETTGVMYSDDVFTDILSQSGCVGIRIYNGMDDNGNLTNVLVGVDINGNDLVEGKIYEYGARCPPKCSANNPLNT